MTNLSNEPRISRWGPMAAVVGRITDVDVGIATLRSIVRPERNHAETSGAERVACVPVHETSTRIICNLNTLGPRVTVVARYFPSCRMAPWPCIVVVFIDFKLARQFTIGQLQHRPGNRHWTAIRSGIHFAVIVPGASCILRFAKQSA